MRLEVVGAEVPANQPREQHHQEEEEEWHGGHHRWKVAGDSWQLGGEVKVEVTDSPACLGGHWPGR